MADQRTAHESTSDHHWMSRALALAGRASGRVAPNPAVGAVLVVDGEVVGEGWTMPPGGPHAEIVALRQAGERARGATLYVTLEPCSHHGRTPPCADALLSAGIARTVVAISDPNPCVNGQGIQRLRDAGVDVETGLLAEQATQINAGFIKRVTTGLPEVTAKFAMSLDGRIASYTGHSRWITGPESRYETHRMRDRHDAILVGIGTVLADDPLLTTRIEPHDAGDGGPHHPLRVVLDSSARTPVTAAMLQPGFPGRTLIAVTERAAQGSIEALTKAGAEVLLLPDRDGRVDLRELLFQLGERGINSVMVEGGGRVHGAFFDAGLVDRLVAFVAPIIIGGSGSPAPVSGLGVERVDGAHRLEAMQVEQIGSDIMISGRVRSRLTSEQEEVECSAVSSRRSAPSCRSIPAEATTH